MLQSNTNFFFLVVICVSVFLSCSDRAETKNASNSATVPKPGTEFPGGSMSIELDAALKHYLQNDPRLVFKTFHGWIVVVTTDFSTEITTRNIVAGNVSYDQEELRISNGQDVFYVFEDREKKLIYPYTTTLELDNSQHVKIGSGQVVCLPELGVIHLADIVKPFVYYRSFRKSMENWQETIQVSYKVSVQSTARAPIELFSDIDLSRKAGTVNPNDQVEVVAIKNPYYFLDDLTPIVLLGTRVGILGWAEISLPKSDIEEESPNQRHFAIREFDYTVRGF